MLSKYKLNQLYFKDTQFANLMTRRIFNVLLIANPYDAFMLEDDGRIDEKIFNEYTSLSLRYPPRFSQVSTEEEALAQLENMSFDLVICMPSTGDNDSFDIGRHIKDIRLYDKKQKRQQHDCNNADEYALFNAFAHK